MESQKLKDFITTQSKFLRKYYSSADKDKLILATVVKLSEELGELSQEVLAHQSLQRKEKLKNHDPQNLAKEFADLIITTLILAKWMDIDIDQALEEKIKIIKSRRNKQKKHCN